MIKTVVVACAVVAATMFICSPVLKTCYAQPIVSGVPEDAIESRVAEKPENHAVRIVAAFMHFDAGRFAKAEEHFAKAASLKPDDPYDQAWLFMAQLRQDPKAPDSKIREFLKGRNGDEFVDTDIRILLGDTSPQEGVERADASKDPGNLCEAHFYAGQRLLANGEQQKAQEHLAEAIKTKQEAFWEYKIAFAYLKGLTK